MKSNRIIIKGVPQHVGASDIAKYFDNFGQSSDIFLPGMGKGPDGQHRGCCYVTFTNPSSVGVVMVYSEHYIAGQKVDVEVADPKPDDKGKGKGGGGGWAAPPSSSAKGSKLQKPRHRLFIPNLPAELNQLDLQVHFEPHGDVVDVYVPPRHGGGGHKGIGFVTFAERDDLLQALDTPHTIHGHRIRCNMAVEDAARGGKSGDSCQDLGLEEQKAVLLRRLRLAEKSGDIETLNPVISEAKAANLTWRHLQAACSHC